MTDRRRVTLPPPQGRPDTSTLPTRPRVAVIGGGIAGLAAACGLAERGVDVEVFERTPHLGGRVAGWSDAAPDGTPLAMNRGFHAFFRQYYNLRKLLRRIDPALSMLTAVDDYPLVDAAGRRDTFQGLPKAPPFNALAFAARSPTFRLRDMARLDARAAAPLAAVSVPRIYDDLDDRDAERFLRDINFPVAARHLAFEVFSRSFFAPPDELSAAELATMFHIYFLGSSEGLVFDVAAANFDVALWNPLREHLEGLGVRFHLERAVTSVRADDEFTVTFSDGGEMSADGVVVATDASGLRAIVDQSPEIGNEDWRAGVAGLRTAPPFVVHRMWLDKPVRGDRPAFLGTGGLPPLDNVSVLDRYEREAAEWRSRTGGSVVELHSYAVRGSGEDLRDRLLARLHELFEETADATIVHERVLCRDDCPRFAPGDFATRPGVTTPTPGLVLAGDGIRIDLPVALMERAATTGWTAANHLLTQFGVAGHVLHTVPTRGRSTALRTLARRAMRTSR